MPLPSALLLAATYPNPPVLQPTSPRTQGANTPIGLVGHRIPHRSATASSSFPPSLLPSLPPSFPPSFSYIWMHSSLPVKFSPFPSPSPSPSPSSLSPLSDTYVRPCFLNSLMQLCSVWGGMWLFQCVVCSCVYAFVSLVYRFNDSRSFLNSTCDFCNKAMLLGVRCKACK